MTQAGRQEVGQAEAEGEDNLSADHGCSEERSRPPELHEGHQVHPLILCLLQQGVDPAVVSLHLPQGLEVPHHAGSKARDPGHSLQEDTPAQHNRPLSASSQTTPLYLLNTALSSRVSIFFCSL